MCIAPRQVPPPHSCFFGDTTPCRMTGVTLHSHVRDLCLERPSGALPPDIVLHTVPPLAAHTSIFRIDSNPSP